MTAQTPGGGAAPATGVSCECGRNKLTTIALLLAAIAVGGSLWLSLGMSLKPCPLCYYQRAFALAAFGVLAVGLVAKIIPSNQVSLMALPVAFAGLTIASWHVWLETQGMKCPKGILQVGTAPQQSQAILGLLTLILLLDSVRGLKYMKGGALGLALALLLGVGLGYGGIASASAFKPTPEERPVMCYKPS
jgi:disulfide bond formation protein DsbB